MGLPYNTCVDKAHFGLVVSQWVYKTETKGRGTSKKPRSVLSREDQSIRVSAHNTRPNHTIRFWRFRALRKRFAVLRLCVRPFLQVQENDNAR
jgi:hypothetical protein